MAVREGTTVFLDWLFGLDVRAVQRFDRFTPQIRQVFERAAAEAGRHGHSGIGVVHLLAAMADAPGCAAAEMLNSVAIAPETLYAAVRPQLLRIEVTDEELTGLLPSAKRAIELAVVAARGELRDDFIGTQHLLLGIMRAEDDEAARVLATLGVHRDAMLTRARTVRVETSRRG